MSEEMNLTPGTTIGHFRLERLLGKGGMGVVYLAEDLILSRQVAIKFMSKTALASMMSSEQREKMEQRFIREAKNAAKINHPNIAQIYEANFETDNWYIAMEFIDGLPLDLILKEKGCLLSKNVEKIACDVIAGLQFSWDSYKIVHRDIKPQNIMLTKNNFVKIVDLGLAKPISDLDNEDHLELTGAGIPIGTPHYMAPEQAEGKTVDFKTDIYALGATMYELLTGKKVFSGKTAAVIYGCQISKKYESLKNFSIEIPDKLITLIDRMLEPDPSERIGNYNEILKILGDESVLFDDEAPTILDAEALGTAVTGVVNYSAEASPEDVTRMGDETINQMYQNGELLLDRYKIIKLIGRGNSGSVYHCLDQKTGIECGLKNILPGREYSAASMPNVFSNYEKLKIITHPNLVEVYDVSQNQETGEIIVITELLNGCNLLDYTHKIHLDADKHVDIKILLPIFAIVGYTLDSVYEKFNLIHNDLKPVSLFLTENGKNVKILDYGVTYLPPEKDQHKNSSDFYKVPIASPDYMSPEMWQHKQVDNRADQYALAVIIYEILSKKLPFWLKEPCSQEKESELSSIEFFLKRQYDRVVYVPALPLLNYSEKINNNVLKALSKEPDQRFETVSDFIYSLSKKASKMFSSVFAIILVFSFVIIGIFFMPYFKSSADNQLIELKVKLHLQIEKNKKSSKFLEEALQNLKKGDGFYDNRQFEKAKIQYEHAKTSYLKHKDFRKKIGDKLDEMQSKLTIEMNVLETYKFISSNLKETIDILKKKQKDIQQYIEKKDFAKALSQSTFLLKKNRLLKTEIEKNILPRFQKNFKDKESSFLSQRKRFKDYEADLPELVEIDKKFVMAQKQMKIMNVQLGFKYLTETQEQCLQLSQKLKQILQRKASMFFLQAEKIYKKTLMYKDFSTEINKILVECEVAFLNGETATIEKRFIDAIKEFKKINLLSKSLIQSISSKFKAIPGKDWNVPKLNISLIWVQEMNCWVGQYEITYSQYKNFKPNHIIQEGRGILDKDDMPVCEVNFHSVMAFCKWLTQKSLSQKLISEGYKFQIPSASEWKKIARCGKEKLYPWGNQWPPPKGIGNLGERAGNVINWKLGNFSDNYKYACKVKQSGVNEWKIYGLSGNVWEWTTDSTESLKNDVYGGSWRSVTPNELSIDPQGNYASSGKFFNDIGFRIILKK